MRIDDAKQKTRDRKKKPAWRDSTSYSRGECGVVEPRQWSLDLGAIEITVHGYLGCDGWFVSTRGDLSIERRALVALKIEKARAEAIEYVGQRVDALTKALTGACLIAVEA